MFLRCRLFICFLGVAVSAGCALAAADPLPAISRDDRILILAPHPDDESIATAGVIQKALRSGARVKVVYLTNGDHNELAFIVYKKRLILRRSEFISMGIVRKAEAVKAMKFLGVDEKDLVFLGYPDFGTFNIFMNFWHSERPFRDLLTRISSVPYKEDLSYGAPYVGESILADIKRVLQEYRPTKIFVSHPADVNVDHKTFYLFLEIALADLEGLIPEPKIYPYLVHHVGWPLPRHYRPQLELKPPAEFTDSEMHWFSSPLDAEELEKKHQAILCYKSQTESSAFYLLAFARKNELFGNYPEITLLAPVKPASEKSWHENVLSFFGFSNMYIGSDVGAMTEINNIIEGDGKGRVSYALNGTTLVIRVQKKRPIPRRFSFLFYLCGYKYGTPFASMPKIRVAVKQARLKVMDKRKVITDAGVTVIRSRQELMVEVPLKALGDPDFILSSVKTYSGFLPVDAASFRKIRLTPARQQGGVQAK